MKKSAYLKARRREREAAQRKRGLIPHQKAPLSTSIAAARLTVLPPVTPPVAGDS